MSSIPAAAGALAGGNDVSSNGFNDMSSEDFIKIIFTELQQQDLALLLLIRIQQLFDYFGSRILASCCACCFSSAVEPARSLLLGGGLRPLPLLFAGRLVPAG